MSPASHRRENESPADTRFAGTLIKLERLRKNWSQEGLCRGICAVSYLSKIEQRKVDANGEIIRLLLRRLGTEWHDGELECRRAAELAARMYEAVFAMDKKSLSADKRKMDENWETLSQGPFMLDFLLLRAVLTKEDLPFLREFTSVFSDRQQTLWLLQQGKYEELLRQHPSAYAFLAAGLDSYQSGNYPVALERLQRSYDLAAAQGYAAVMLESRILIGNCYSENMEFDRMREHFRVAERLAKALDDRESLETIRYNTQSTNLELGRVEESYDYFSALEHPTAMALHKLAVCCEKLGKVKKAIDAVNRAEAKNDDFPPKDLTREMCELVRYRLEHPDYRRESAYGGMLLACFERIRKELPYGHAIFHLPWVLEWYTANRQYKQAFELLEDFPVHKDLV